MLAERARAFFATAIVVGGILPVTAITGHPRPVPVDSPDVPRVSTAARAAATVARLRPARAAAADMLDPDSALLSRVSFEEALVSIVPPAGWQPAPAASLNPQSTPPSAVFELVRFQLRIGDQTLYTQPIPVTSGLVRDAGAVLSVGVAREGGELVGMDLDVKGEAESRGGFEIVEETSVYEGIATLTRYLVARGTDRVLVLQAVADADEWAAIEPEVRAALASVVADKNGPHGPAAPPPPAPEPEPQPAAAVEPPPDPSAQARAGIISRAASLLGLPYVWGGNSTSRGMDCSAYVSWVWGVSRYTTDSIWAVSHPISKDELRPGDAMNLTIGRDPSGRGHIRIFEAWANEARTLVWVYEETPPRAVHRVIAYDHRYQPIRLNGLSGAGAAPLVIAPPSAVQPADTWFPSAPAAPRRATPRPSTPRPVVTRTPRPVVTRTPAPTPRTTARPSGSARPTPTVRASGTARPAATARTSLTAAPVRTAVPAPATARPAVPTPRPTTR